MDRERLNEAKELNRGSRKDSNELGMNERLESFQS